MNILNKLQTALFNHKSPHEDSALLDTAYNAASSVLPSMVSFQPLEWPADSDIIGSLESMRARSRDIIRNSSIGAGIIKLMVRGVIGDGLKLMPAINGELLGLSQEETDKYVII